MDSHTNITFAFHMSQPYKGTQRKSALDTDANMVRASGCDRSPRRGVTVIVIPQLHLIPLCLTPSHQAISKHAEDRKHIMMS
jgi:hypothetical protein